MCGGVATVPTRDGADRAPRLGPAGRITFWLCALLLGLRLLTLPLYPLTDRTESRYAELARQMCVQGDWVTPRFHDRPFWGKPPLATWCQAASMAVVGVDELGARLPAWLAGVASVWLVYITGRRLGGGVVGARAALIFCSAPLTLFMAGGVMTDPFLGLGLALALYGTVRAAEESSEDAAPSRPWCAPMCVALGLAMATLAKGPVALLLGGAPLAVSMRVPSKGQVRCMVVPWCAGAFVWAALTLPWFVLAELHSPGFCEYFLVGEHFHRFLTPDWKGDLYGGTHPTQHGMIWLYFAVGWAPWVLPGLGSLWRGLRCHGAAPILRTRSLRLLVAAALAPLGLFTLAGSTLPTYAYPAVAPASLLLALACSPRAASGGVRSAVPVRRPALVLVVLATLVGVLACVPDGIWRAHSQRHILETEDAGFILYACDAEHLYSARFYGGTRVAEAASADDPLWQRVRWSLQRVALVTVNDEFDRIPISVRDRLVRGRNGGDRYQVWTLTPPQP